jgi:SRSO17 transposase
MITRAIAAKVPFSFVATDTVYGTGTIEALLRNAGKGYVLGVAVIVCSIPGAREAAQSVRRNHAVRETRRTMRRPRRQVATSETETTPEDLTRDPAGARTRKGEGGVP